MNRARVFPSVFVSHGAPSLILEASPTNRFLRDLGPQLGRPAAVLCVSAHWEAAQPTVGAAAAPSTIHDFYGFPRELYEVRYPAPGEPALASRVVELLEGAGISAEADPVRGLDHGAWVPLKLMFPGADVPVVQLAVQSGRGPGHHLALGRALAPLRQEGVLILGSGGATHNLREFGGYGREAQPIEYARAFDDWLRDAVTAGRTPELEAYRERAPEARRNHPTPEHFLPLFVPLGAAPDGAKGRVLHRAFEYGVLSMAAFAWD